MLAQAVSHAESALARSPNDTSRRELYTRIVKSNIFLRRFEKADKAFNHYKSGLLEEDT